MHSMHWVRKMNRECMKTAAWKMQHGHVLSPASRACNSINVYTIKPVAAVTDNAGGLELFAGII